MSTAFPEWDFLAQASRYSRSHNGIIAIVARLDGRNWGWFTSDDNGQILKGECTAKLDLWDAIDHAQQALGV